MDVGKVEKAEKTPTTSLKIPAQLSNPEPQTSAKIETSGETSSTSSKASLGGNQNFQVIRASLETSTKASVQPTPPEETSTNIPNMAKISVTASTSQIETIASYNNLKSLKKKVSLAIEKMFKKKGDGIPPNLLSECLTTSLSFTGFYDM
ncbi:hypothetical protein B9Z55_023515 [Caenorhabditis nigoni]|uniref:Uncharacterized protein n=1 Tax=Caenorhabditis nigoni TaxID=1611254 RepID=A0A2G5SQE0_9PELO|nr:hypothetical protein B9Z55_023515 [Caenorhabditis nigoni]